MELRLQQNGRSFATLKICQVKKGEEKVEEKQRENQIRGITTNHDPGRTRIRSFKDLRGNSGRKVFCSCTVKDCPSNRTYTTRRSKITTRM